MKFAILMDTPLLVCALSNAGAPCNRVLEVWEKGRVDLVIGEWQMKSLEQVSWTQSRAQHYLNTLRDLATIVPGTKAMPIRENPDNLRLLAAALEGKAQYIITYGSLAQHVLVYEGIICLTPHEFLDIKW